VPGLHDISEYLQLFKEGPKPSGFRFDLVPISQIGNGSNKNLKY